MYASGRHERPPFAWTRLRYLLAIRTFLVSSNQGWKSPPCSISTMAVPSSAAAAQPPQLDEPPYPSFRDARGRLSEAAKRLFWPLKGDFPSAISVMKTPSTPFSLEPFCRPDGTWHEIAQLPLSEPKCSYVAVEVAELDQWEWNWLQQHEGHSTNEFITYGEMDDDDRPGPAEMNEDGEWEEADSDTEYLIACCGEDRPQSKNIRNVVRPSAGKDFVTIYDYVNSKSFLCECKAGSDVFGEACHPWLVSLRRSVDLQRTAQHWHPPSAELMVDAGSQIRVNEKDDWIMKTEGARMCGPITESTARLLDKMRKERESRGKTGPVSVSEVANVSVA